MDQYVSEDDSSVSNLPTAACTDNKTTKAEWTVHPLGFFFESSKCHYISWILNFKNCLAYSDVNATRKSGTFLGSAAYTCKIKSSDNRIFGISLELSMKYDLWPSKLQIQMYYLPQYLKFTAESCDEFIEVN